MTPPNIGLIGKLRSGKDSVAAYLIERYDYTRFAFGDGIKDVCRRLYPDQFADGRKPRALLQGVGQTLRTFDENVWVNDLFARIGAVKRLDASMGAPPNARLRAVISDVRQPNEVERLRREGYVLVRVNAPVAIRIERAKAAGDAFDLASLTHETEQHVDTFYVDYNVYNAGTLEALHTQIDRIMTKLTEVDA